MQMIFDAKGLMIPRLSLPRCAYEREISTREFHNTILDIAMTGLYFRYGSALVLTLRHRRRKVSDAHSRVMSASFILRDGYTRARSQSLGRAMRLSIYRRAAF